MALINCAECSAEISDKSAACVKCGAPVAAQAQLDHPSAPLTGTSFKWWWIPIGLVGVFFLFGALIPKNVADSNAARKVCMESFKQTGAPAPYECDRIADEIRSRK